MTETLEVKSNAKERTLEIPMPKVLCAKDLKELVTIAGEDLCYAKIIAQLKIDFRSKVRTMMESETDGELSYSDEEILSTDFTDWIPEGRRKKTIEEKIQALLGSEDPAKIAEILKSVKAATKN